MKTNTLVLFSICLFLSGFVWAQYPIVRCQSDWHAGDGVAIAVDDWDAEYLFSSGMNYGSLPLVLLSDSAHTVYDNWVRMTVDTGTMIGTHNSCAYPADFNCDNIQDIIANVSDSTWDSGYVVWYEGLGGCTYDWHILHTYERHTANWIAEYAASFPTDLDCDGHIDVVAHTPQGLYRFMNDSCATGWTQYSIFTPPGSEEYYASYIDIADADGNGFPDILIGEGMYREKIVIYWTFPTMWGISFAREVIDSATYLDIWRLQFLEVDSAEHLGVVFNNNTWPDRITTILRQEPPYTYPHTFSEVFSTAIIEHIDGLWASDYENDGDEDVIFARNQAGNFYILENDGGSFTQRQIITVTGIYGDGAMMSDIDGDGMKDILGTHTRVGFFRRLDMGDNFWLYDIDGIPSSSSHWIYPFNCDGEHCSGDMDIDLLLIYDDIIAIYRNEMFQYEPIGSLLSSALAIPLPVDTCVVCSLFWDGCELPEYEVIVYGRCGKTAEQCTTSIFSPFTGPYYTSGGIEIDRFERPVDTLWTQYFILFIASPGPYGISPSIDSVWVKIHRIPCSCDSISAIWGCPCPGYSFVSCENQQAQLFLWTDSTAIDTSKIYLRVEDESGEHFLSSPSDSMVITSLSPICDSIMIEIIDFTWIDEDSISLMLDSAYTSDGCRIIW